MEEAANHDLIQQHRTIHLGMEQFEKDLKNCRSKEKAFSLLVLERLDQEVEELGRRGEDENMLASSMDMYVNRQLL
ncbi:hypothetical protein NCU07838 [Neurospora crassa OR74A]|uniref:Uncharacterized protein n=1 Tax=Neurospora crassa (strain ATCC 24698 / 74-OR23-1A / CBS 708.71 / DSM 1257 / FGSC 987) TaxID=367110 RepID=Q7SBC7_NEUCR|nr:hypothetical protein NCU07838 [Neurospora crassa OR74A]EAA33723.3 hypothetical protein NCU07838 [Neurospora crassa OR74A]|eukprot:XP_962959.3 hypothetical protein NCU07838 [Neurospora crassa OR74A]